MILLRWEIGTFPPKPKRARSPDQSARKRPKEDEGISHQNRGANEHRNVEVVGRGIEETELGEAAEAEKEVDGE